MEHKELAILSLLVGLFLPFVCKKIWAFFIGVLQVLCGSFYNAYAMGVLMGVFVAAQFFWLQQWIFAYNAIHSPENLYNKYAYFPLTVVIPVFFLNIFFVVFSAIRFTETATGKAE